MINSQIILLVELDNKAIPCSDVDAEHFAEYVDAMLNNGLITVTVNRDTRKYYEITSKGAALVRFFRNTPLPEQKWYVYMPCDKEIDCSENVDD